MEDDELYKKYLESVFYRGDETYFYNVKTQEIMPDHLTLDSVSHYFLNYIIRCMYDFMGYDVSNLDFSGTNAAINPQTVYDKDMSNGNYSDVTFL